MDCTSPPILARGRVCSLSVQGNLLFPESVELVFRRQAETYHR
jgi:hypothetical protein